MSRKFFVKFLVVLAFLAAAVLWLLSVLVPDTFGFFNLNWAVALFAGVGGLAFLFNGFAEKNSVTLKKMNIILGACLLVIAAVCIAFALALPKNLVWPIIAVILAAALVIGLFATGGKKWDEGDNHKAGYKNYYERKKEEGKNKEDK